MALVVMGLAAGCTRPAQSSADDAGVDLPDAAHTACNPDDDHTCNDEVGVSALWGLCQPDGTCQCLPGYPSNPVSGRCRRSMVDGGGVIRDAGGAVDAALTVDAGSSSCTPGADQTCNDSPTLSSLQGSCLPTGTCICLPGNFLNPFTGRCRSGVLECQARGGSCVQTATDTGPCPTGSYSPFSGLLSSCFTNVPRTCCIPEGNLGSSCTTTCTDGACLSEASGYPAGGLCTHACVVTSDCAAWAICLPVPFSQARGMCMLPCRSDDSCRTGWSCQPMPNQPFVSGGDTTNVCWKSSAQVPKGQGMRCAADGDCLSSRCQAPDAGSTAVCTSPCSNAQPCLPGFTCQQGWCFPT